jgi:hypothetical protein
MHEQGQQANPDQEIKDVPSRRAGTLLADLDQEDEANAKAID